MALSFWMFSIFALLQNFHYGSPEMNQTKPLVYFLPRSLFFVKKSLRCLGGGNRGVVYQTFPGGIPWVPCSCGVSNGGVTVSDVWSEVQPFDDLIWDIHR